MSLFKLGLVQDNSVIDWMYVCSHKFYMQLETLGFGKRMVIALQSLRADGPSHQKLGTRDMLAHMVRAKSSMDFVHDKAWGLRLCGSNLRGILPSKIPSSKTLCEVNAVSLYHTHVPFAG